MKFFSHYTFILLFFVSLFTLPMYVQGQSRIQVGKVLNYKQPVTPQGADNYLYSTIYFHGRKAYNMKGFAIGTAPYDVLSVKYNPVGTTYTILSGKNKKSNVSVYDAWQEDKVIHEFRDVIQPVALCYSADSRTLYVAEESGTINVYDSKSFQRIASWGIPASPHIIKPSSNGYFLAVASRNQVSIINVESGAIRTTLAAKARVNDIAFSEDAQLFGIVSQDGTLTVWDTKSFSKVGEYADLGLALSLAFHPEGKYVSVLTSDNSICFQNLTDASDRPVITDAEGGLSYLSYLKDGKQNGRKRPEKAGAQIQGPDLLPEEPRAAAGHAVFHPAFTEHEDLPDAGQPDEPLARWQGQAPWPH